MTEKRKKSHKKFNFFIFVKSIQFCNPGFVQVYENEQTF